jgi:DNA-binding winged helix-turn-helix (wHTH) protein
MNALASEQLSYRFGPFVLDPKRRLLTRHGKTVALRPTVFDTLAFLLANPGRVVTKEELLEAVWPGRVVEESNISQTIFMLRNALGEEHPIVTAPGLGYRFTATVTQTRSRRGNGGPFRRDSGVNLQAANEAGPASATTVGDQPGAVRVQTMMGGLVLPFLDQILYATAQRGRRYEGFYRSTRPYAGHPGRFIHDHLLVRMGADGLLRFKMVTGDVFAEGWVLPIQDQLFIIGTEFTGGALLFAVMHGVHTEGVDVLDGITLNTSYDIGRTPTATAFIHQRIGDLTDDSEADDAHLADLATANPIAPQGSVPEALGRHLARDCGPLQVALGGDWVLRLPLARSLSRGPPPDLP